MQIAFIFEIIFEVLLEFVFTIVAEVVMGLFQLLLAAIFEMLKWLGWELTDENDQAARRDRLRRALPVLHLVFLSVSIGVGIWWGNNVASSATSQVMMLFWLLIIAVFSAALAWSENPDVPLPRWVSRMRTFWDFAPLSWKRLAWFNFAGAIGVAISLF